MVFSKVVKKRGSRNVGDFSTRTNEVDMQLAQLAQDFVYVAKTYGKIIITERYSNFKTIKPVDIGGIAVLIHTV
jgi:hypothetical protein